MLSSVKEKLKYITGRLIEIILTPIGYVATYFFMKKMHTHREIAKDVLVSSEWTEIVVQPPMKGKKQLQEIMLKIEFCKQDQKKGKLFLRDGTIINPQVQIIDQFSDCNNLNKARTSGMPESQEVFAVSCIHFGYVSKNKEFTKVKIRSDKSFQCEKVIWHDFNMK